MNGRRSAAALLLVAASGCLVPGYGAGDAVGGNLVPPADVKPLRQAAAPTHRHIGAALMSARLSDPSAAQLLAEHFDSLTPENEMKWEAIEPSPGVFSFSAGDELVAFAAAHGLRVRGHTLVWHSQLAPWVKGLSPEGLRQAIARHIERVVGHWQGKIGEWDVVNEAFSDGPSGDLRRESPWRALGPTFIEDAFRLAHAADPAAQLFYNDYEIEETGTAKSEAVYALCKRLKEAGVPISGVGLQMHVDPRRTIHLDRIRENIQRFAALGLLVEFTEMDVPVGAVAGTIEQKLQRQRVLTHDIVAACLAVEGCSGVTFWGLTDRDSWLNSPRWGALRGPGPHYPLPFNRAYQPKPMAMGILDALVGK